MASAPRPPLPVILLANDLLDGEVVFRAETGWTRNPAQALVAISAAMADFLQDEATAAMAGNRVVDAYLVAVTLTGQGQPVPTHFRERFKVLGPSIRTDLGKQADYPLTASPES
jgi:Protein of unknown function (DUF2849)